LESAERQKQAEKKFEKKPWHWDPICQIAFDSIKTTIAKEVVLIYPDLTKPFDVYTDASTPLNS
jgi:hypothetical protein